MTTPGTSHGLGHVLIVDDDEDDIFFHSRALRTVVPEVDIVTAADAEQALDYLRNSKSNVPDLILLDINMPRWSGWDFVSEYDGLPSEIKREVTLVMLTSSDAPRDHDRAHSSNSVADYLTKPLQPESVEGLIQRFFS